MGLLLSGRAGLGMAGAMRKTRLLCAINGTINRQQKRRLSELCRGDKMQLFGAGITFLDFQFPVAGWYGISQNEAFPYRKLNLRGLAGVRLSVCLMPPVRSLADSTQPKNQEG